MMTTICSMVGDNKTPPQIEAALRVRFGTEAPSLRTVQYIVRELDPPDPSAPWSLADADPDDARHVLPVLAAVIERERTLTTGAAEWIVRLSRAGAGDMKPWNLYRLARMYQAWQGEGAETAVLDAFVAFAPWRGEGAGAKWYAYARSLKEPEGRVPIYFVLADLLPETPKEKARRLSRELTGKDPETETIAGFTTLRPQKGASQ